MNNPIYNRNKPKPSTFTVPQQSQPPQSQPSKQEQVKHQPKPSKPSIGLDHFLLQARRDEAQVDVTLINGKEYAGARITAVERYMLVIVHDRRDIAIMKTSVATVARCVNGPLS
jgi:sRNA-binding regulator protein Hfq